MTDQEAASGQPAEHTVVEELRRLDPHILDVFLERDAASRLLTLLPTRYSTEQVATPPGDRVWELAGLLF
jgi:hypothetical protein